MELEKYLNGDYIIVAPFSIKKKVLLYLTKIKQIKRSKIVTLSSLIEEEQCREKAIYQIVSAGISPSLADIFLSYLPVAITESASSKVSELIQLEDTLRQKGILKKREKISFQNQKFVVYGYPSFTKKEKLFLESLQKENTVEILPSIPKKGSDYCYATFSTTEEELATQMEKITHLLKEGIHPSQIKILVPDRSYLPLLHRFFTLFSVPYDLRQKKSLLSYDMTRYFLELLEESMVEEALALIAESFDVKDSFQGKIYQKIEKKVASLFGLADQDCLKKTITYLLEKETIQKEGYTNAVCLIHSLEEVEEGDILFVVGMHAGSFPLFHKDDAYLSDIEREETLEETSLEQNRREEKEALFYLSFAGQVYFSYAERSLQAAYAESPFLAQLDTCFTLTRIKPSYTYTNFSYNQYLLARHLDLYMKYHQKSKELSFLHTHTSISYLTYQNQYQPISSDDYSFYLQNHLTLSYSSVETFYKCQFRFYIENIVKIRTEKEDSISQIFGNMVHKILSLVLREEVNHEDVVTQVIDEYFPQDQMTAKEAFYVTKYKTEILKLLSIIEEQRGQTEFKETAFEERISLEEDREMQITFKGYIDKVLTFEDENTKYVIILDYKTGVITPSFSTVVHGLGMQLLLYYYLWKKQNPTHQFAGVYWQNVLKEVLPSESGKTYDAILKDAYRWVGYTLDSASLVGHIDQNVESSFIKSLKLKKDGTFYFYSKVLSKDKMEKLLILTEEKKEEAEEKILKRDFKINPKKIGNEKMDAITGCMYCPYGDICYKKNRDIVSLKAYKDLEFLEGEENG